MQPGTPWQRQTHSCSLTFMKSVVNGHSVSWVLLSWSGEWTFSILGVTFMKWWMDFSILGVTFMKWWMDFSILGVTFMKWWMGIQGFGCYFHEVVNGHSGFWVLLSWSDDIQASGCCFHEVVNRLQHSGCYFHEVVTGHSGFWVLLSWSGNCTFRVPGCQSPSSFSHSHNFFMESQWIPNKSFRISVYYWWQETLAAIK